MQNKHTVNNTDYIYCLGVKPFEKKKYSGDLHSRIFKFLYF